jgi:hypothetical protein
MWIDAVYGRFRRDFITSRPVLGGLNVGVSRALDTDGRERRFWHLATEGVEEKTRVPHPRRCERIAWPRAIIDALVAALPEVRSWPQRRSRQNMLVLGLDDFSYVVVLAAKPTHYLLITAFCVVSERRRATYRREWERAART